MSYIAIGLNKSGCQFGMPSCIGIMSGSFGRYVAGLHTILENEDKLETLTSIQIPKALDLFTMIGISKEWNTIVAMTSSITCCIGGYLCHTLPLSRLRTEAREEYGIEVFIFFLHEFCYAD